MASRPTLLAGPLIACLILGCGSSHEYNPDAKFEPGVTPAAKEPIARGKKSKALKKTDMTKASDTPPTKAIND